MDLLHIILLLLAGVAGGTLAAIAGGAGIVTFPVLLATGISPVTAAASNMVALTPGNFIAAFYDRSQLPPLGRSFAVMVVASVLGALLGAALLLLTPVRVFSVLIPLLLAFATVLFVYAPRLSAWLIKRAAARGGAGPHHWGRSIGWLLPVSLYGGYFGAGVGVLLLGVMSVGTNGDYRSANVTKNLVNAFNSMTAATFFAVQGSVAWPQALAMMAGALAGGLLGARIAQVLPNHIARAIVIAAGVILTVAFAWRYWF